MSPIKKLRDWYDRQEARRLHLMTLGELSAGYWRNRVSLFWTRVVLVGVLIAGGFALASVKANDHAFCDGLKSNRAILVQVVNRAYTQSQGGFDLTTLQGYELIADAGTKLWVDSFQAVIALAGKTSPHDRDKNHVPDEIDTLLRQKVC